jgi:hypothetical protein
MNKTSRFVCIFLFEKIGIHTLCLLLREKKLQLIPVYEYNCLLHPLHECRVFMLIGTDRTVENGNIVVLVLNRHRI